MDETTGILAIIAASGCPGSYNAPATWVGLRGSGARIALVAERLQDGDMLGFTQRQALDA